MLQGTVRRVDGFATVAPECEARPVAKGEPESPGSLPEASRNLCLGGRERLEYEAKGCEIFRPSLGIDGPDPSRPDDTSHLRCDWHGRS